MPTSQEIIVLGAEYDDELRKTLGAIFQELGAIRSADEWGIAGSQEVQSLKFRFGETSILIESETYVGLSITGDSNLVRQIAALVKSRTSVIVTRDSLRK